ncbi:hypothetical protein FJM67_00245 [Maribrevibacterium harenarium]|uniref:Uncharacterized protein n=1 Tax=Maribrevibacterium harenarium TaxID=2589817 RepID=A0A501X4S7_9GAMM|nr:hypothetical protein [Maribrevibacterium harenarium]TPE55516.1 hypothetical protein FJM67_00245 [Maribrevibacterium harenarium]
MPKWILWALLEVSTVMVFISAFLFWRGAKLRRRQDDSSDSELSAEATTEPTGEEAEERNMKQFAAFLDKQVTFAAEKLKSLRPVDDLTLITRFKIWGTLLKAERAIILNEASSRPRPILNRFMASILNAVASSSGNQQNKENLTLSIREVDDEFKQAGELLLSKEELINNQKLLHKDITDSIDRASKRLNRLKIKEQELARLSAELDKLRRQNEKLQAYHNEPISIAPKPSAISKNEDRLRHDSHKHLQSLQHLSDRQQTVIEQLQAQLAQQKENGSQQDKDNRTVALQRMERLVNESKSLIGQLNNELDTTNLSIESLKEDISKRDQELQALEQKLQQENATAVGQFTKVNSSKKDTLNDFMTDISDAKANDAVDNAIYEEQEKEVKVLERLLQESETCVQLLVQELEIAEKENQELLQQLDRKAARMKLENSVNKTLGSTNDTIELNRLRQRNRQLVEATTNLKNQLVNAATHNQEKELRTEYNRKSLELDRLQLAYSDLERKYLGTLN